MNIQVSLDKNIIENPNFEQQEAKKTLKKSSSTLFNKKNLILQNSGNNAEKPTNAHLNNFLLNSENNNKIQSKSLDRIIKSPGNITNKNDVQYASPKKVLNRERSEQNFNMKHNIDKIANNNASNEKKVNQLSLLNNYTNRNSNQKNIKLQSSSNQNSTSFRSKMNDKSLEIKKKTMEKSESIIPDNNIKMNLNKSNNGYLYNAKLKIPDNNIKSLKYNNFTKPKSANISSK